MAVLLHRSKVQREIFMPRFKLGTRAAPKLFETRLMLTASESIEQTTNDRAGSPQIANLCR
jgi:hypothetical protein